MTELLQLVPRPAGDGTVEPVVVFDQTAQAVAAQDRCPVSCVCHDATNACWLTGNSHAE